MRVSKEQFAALMTENPDKECITTVSAHLGDTASLHRDKFVIPCCSDIIRMIMYTESPGTEIQSGVEFRDKKVKLSSEP